MADSSVQLDPKVIAQNPSAADAEDISLSGISIAVTANNREASTDVMDSMADYVGGRDNIYLSPIGDRNYKHASKTDKMSWAVCGDLSIMGLKDQSACFGQDQDPGGGYRGEFFHFGVQGWELMKGEDPSRYLLNPLGLSRVCEPTTGTCLQEAPGDNPNVPDFTALETIATKCIWPQPGGIDNVYYGCADTMQLVAPSVVEKKSCVDQHECMALSLLNLGDYAFTPDSKGVLTYDDSVSVPATTAVCKMTPQDPTHGYGKGSSNLTPAPRSDTGSSPLSWTTFRSKQAVGGDTRIQTTVDITWASDGNCDSPDGAATYSVNWDPRDGKGQLSQGCQTTKQPQLANGYVQQCTGLVTYNQDLNYVTWNDVLGVVSEKAQNKAEEASESLWDSLTGKPKEKEEEEEGLGNETSQEIGGYIADLALMLLAGDKQLITQIGIQTVSSSSVIMDGLREGQTLYPGEKLTSPNGETVLSLTKAGNVTLTDGSGKSSNLNNTGAPVPGSTLKLQSDLNLVLTTPDGEVNWAAGTDTPGELEGGELSVTDDGTATISFIPENSGGDRTVIRTLSP